MYLLAFLVIMLAVVAGAGFGIWAGSWLYYLCPLKGHLAYILGCFIVLPAACIALLVGLVMPVAYFLGGMGKIGKP